MPETDSLEIINPCHILVMYEDATAYDLAIEVCSGVMARFDAELRFVFSSWKFNDLTDPDLAQWAAEAGERADIIIFCLPPHDLNPETVDWLASIQTRTKPEGALAMLLTQSPGASLAPEGLLARLQQAAFRLQMDFLPLLPLPQGIGMQVNSPPVLLNRSVDESGGNHWGLNE